MPPRYALPSLNDSLTDFIETIPSPLDRQHALSVLSRTSTTYNALLSHKLYLRPALTSEKRVELWSRTYWARSNPWSLCDPKMSFKEVIVPVSVSLNLEKHQNKSKKAENTEFSSFFWCSSALLAKNRRRTVSRYDQSIDDAILLSIPLSCSPHLSPLISFAILLRSLSRQASLRPLSSSPDS